MNIAVVGAGLAGLVCARQLQEQGNQVVVYEKSDEIGGRMSTRQTELGGFDYGAQYFTASSENFKKAIVEWRKAGWVSAWEGKLVSLENGVSKPAGRSAERLKQRYVAVPGMSALGQQLAQGLDMRTGQLVKRIEAHGDQWLLTMESDSVPVDADARLFDAVILAVPAVQSISLLQVAPRLAAQAGQARFAPCWALMLGFQDSLDLNYDGAWVQSSRLSWIARDTSKQQRRPGEHWVAHASADWSLEHFDDDAERAKEKLLRAFHDATGSQVQPIYATVHKWPFAHATQPIPGECLWDDRQRIGACGDWFAAGLEGSGRVENAYLSGLAMAEALRLAVH
ncbi:MAG: NAD(P)/FAD-dependent oxidoreductase [Burkholderiales bacterium]